MASTPCVLLMGTCDTKLQELLFTRRAIKQTSENINVILLDVGRTSQVNSGIDITSFEVLSRHNGKDQIDISSLPRGEVISHMIEACTPLVKELYEKKSIHGAIALGGSGGTSLAASVMRNALPIGFPKLVVSTVASGETSSYIGESDITLMPSIVDIAGLNSVLKTILKNAAVAIAAMTKLNFERGLPDDGTDDRAGVNKDKKRIAITMFGVTTPAATAAMKLFSAKGHEVFVFHATGTGGRAMERLIDEDQMDAVLDLTTTELADELVGGIMSAGPERLKAAARKGLPQIVSLGALDMVNFGSKASIPEKFQSRQLFEHNPSITLMRTTPSECKRLGEVIAQRLRENSNDIRKVEVWIPLRGVSIIAIKGGPFYSEKADNALFSALRTGLKGTSISIREFDTDINNENFAMEMGTRLLNMMGL